MSVKLLYDFIEITLRHGCSPVNLLHIFTTAFLKNTSMWLLLVFIFKKNQYHDLYNHWFIIIKWVKRTRRKYFVRILKLTKWNWKYMGACPYYWPNLVSTFPYSDWIRRFTLWISVFSLNTGKYGPGKLRIQKLFT